MGLRSAIRAASPDRLRIAVALARRAWRDSGWVNPRPRLVARARARPAADFPHTISEAVQDIKKGAFADGKLANLRLGAELFDGITVAPGETLSFWKLVGRPTAAAGFEVGRSIRGGIVVGEVGGGLCQLSGIAYEIGLRAGLEPVERHSHSRDLYAEEDRFTPLGLDATVVWPHKDLRLVNPHSVHVQLRFAVRGSTISASIHSPILLEPAILDIARIDREMRREVRVWRRGNGGDVKLISDDSYAVAPA